MGAPEPALLCLTSRDACSRDARKAAIVLSSVIHVLRQRSVALAQPACLAVNHLSAYVMQTRDVPALRFQILPLLLRLPIALFVSPCVLAAVRKRARYVAL